MDVYTGAMGMISFQGKLDVIGNNVANVRTNGYKADHESFKVFQESFMKKTEKGVGHRIGTLQDQLHIDQVATNFEPGLVQQTGKPLDFQLEDAIKPDGTKPVSFFTVQHNGETFLTRNGHYRVDEEGTLSAANGAFLLDTEGNRITLPEGRPYSIESNGRIRLTDTNETVATIAVQQVQEKDLGLLEKAHSSFFRVMTLEDITQHFGPVETILQAFDRNPTVRSVFKDKSTLEEVARTGTLSIASPSEGVLKGGMIEESNVDLSYEMTEMMVAQKGFSASQKVASTFDRINEKAMNELGR